MTALKSFGSYQPNAAHAGVHQSYPTIQWLNGKPHFAQLGGIAYTGGFFLPQTSAFLDTLPAPWKKTRVQFQRGEDAVEEGWGAAGVYMAILGQRLHWKVSGDTQRRLWTTYDPRSGKMISRLQLLVAIRGLATDHPFVITLSGKMVTNSVMQGSNAASINVRLHNNVLRPAQKMTGLIYPTYCFWIKVQAETDGQKPKFRKEGEGQQVTLPVASDLVTPLADEQLRKFYVGDSDAARFEQWVENAQGWLRSDDVANLVHNNLASELLDQQPGQVSDAALQE